MVRTHRQLIPLKDSKEDEARRRDALKLRTQKGCYYESRILGSKETTRGWHLP